MRVTPQKWGLIPEELKSQKSWLLAGPDSFGINKAPYTWSAKGITPALWGDPATRLNFETACELALKHSIGIGYVVDKDDPFCCIDLDVKNSVNEPDPMKWSDEVQINRMLLIATSFNSYTERSQSGQGLHVWIRASIGRGAKYDHVEIYSQERFIVCTGDVYINRPIVEHQQLAEILLSEIRAKQGAARSRVELVEEYEEESDYDIWERAENADNGAKFKQLVEGLWESMGYPSQSEADLALLSIFTFYSESNEQCRRLFRATKLGKRAKAQKDDRYLDFTLGLIRARQADEKAMLARFDFDSAARAAQAVIDKARGLLPPVGHQQNLSPATRNGEIDREDIRNYAASLGPANTATGIAAGTALAHSPNSTANALPAMAYPSAPAPVQGEIGIAWPPGFVGSLASFIYHSAPRPVKEVAIVAALGWIAGVCGRGWNIPGSGLNLYIILVAQSAIGKEAMHTGLGSLLAKLREAFPQAMDFVDFSDYASGPALAKACANNPCFVNVASEWGRKLRRLASDELGDGPMQQLRTHMTTLYQKSGANSVVGGIKYSDKEKNVVSVNGVAYSMIGESTPGTFYESLTATMMEDGFLSRFTIIEYAGLRPEANLKMQSVPHPALVDRCIQLMIQSKQMMSQVGMPVGVSRDSEAAQLIDDFDRECDREINKTQDETWRQMWNRAHLKMLRIAALLSIGENSIYPVITRIQVEWALDLVRRDIRIFRRKFESGEVGIGDGAREKRLITLIKEYMNEEPTAGYKVPSAMWKAGIVPRSYLQIRTSKLSIFTNARNGATKAFDEALRSIADSGYIMEVEKVKLHTDYGAVGKAYRIGSLPNYDTI